MALASKLEIEQVAIAPNKMDWSKTSKEALMARLTIIRLHHFLETNPANLSVTVLQYSRNAMEPETRRPESWDALDWPRRSVFAQVYHISVLLQS